jgi:hypothetical protein
MDHKDEVKYVEEILPGGVELPEGWTVELADDTYVVSGPCPECLGKAYGPKLPGTDVPTSTVLRVDREPRSVREILASCACDSSHGKEGATSCGREWVVRVVVS